MVESALVVEDARLRTLRPAGEINDFVANPIGRYYSGPTYVVWCASPTLCGSAHWGRVSERDARDLVRLYECARHPALARFDVFMDDAAVEHLEWSALSLLSEYLESRLPEWATRIRRQAVVTPSGIVGLILAGLVPLIGPTYAMRYTSSRSAAVKWLDCDELAGVIERVDQIVGEARGVAQVVRALRLYLDRHLVSATLKDAARALQLSERSLQRELRRAGTRYCIELTRARIDSARMLLADTDEKIEFIAHQVGCLSASRLGELFRRELGERPNGYRARHRAASASSACAGGESR